MDSPPQAGLQAAPLVRGGVSLVNPVAALAQRECGPGGGGRRARLPGAWPPPGDLHIPAFHRLPTKPSHVADQMSSRGYIGRFTADGSTFVGALAE
jgi:hypothetical protein